MLDGEAVTIRCAHGTLSFASVHLSIGEKTITVKSVVSETLPVAMLLGELSMLLGREDDHIDDVMVVETRASKERRLEEEKLVRECEVRTGATPTPEGIHHAHTMHTPARLTKTQRRQVRNKQEGPFTYTRYDRASATREGFITRGEVLV